MCARAADASDAELLAAQERWEQPAGAAPGPDWTSNVPDPAANNLARNIHKQTCNTAVCSEQTSKFRCPLASPSYFRSRACTVPCSGGCRYTGSVCREGQAWHHHHRGVAADIAWSGAGCLAQDDDTMPGSMLCPTAAILLAWGGETKQQQRTAFATTTSCMLHLVQFVVHEQQADVQLLDIDLACKSKDGTKKGRLNK